MIPAPIFALAGVGALTILVLALLSLALVFGKGATGWRECPIGNCKDAGRRWPYHSTWTGLTSRVKARWHMRRNHREIDDAWKRDYRAGGSVFAQTERLRRAREAREAP